MRKRSAFKQKPWNKVTRIEKFWIPQLQLANTLQNNTFSTTGSPGYLVFWDPFVQNTQGSATFNFNGPGMGNVKIHRMQGYLRCHGITESESSAPPYNAPLYLLDYVWMVLDKASDTHDAGSFPAVSMNPSLYSSGDMYELLQRDDILSWGTVDVPRSTFHTMNPSSVFDAMSNQLTRPRPSIPFPRIGPMGLNIKRGKALACICAGRALVDGIGGSSVDDGLEANASVVVVDAVYRVLCSA